MGLNILQAVVQGDKKKENKKKGGSQFVNLLCEFNLTLKLWFSYPSGYHSLLFKKKFN